MGLIMEVSNFHYGIDNENLYHAISIMGLIMDYQSNFHYGIDNGNLYHTISVYGF